MATTPATRLQLTQTKLFTGSRFAVRHLAFNPSPEKLRNCFIVEPATGIDLERLVRVATLTDLDDGTIPANPMNNWWDGDVSLASAAPGDILRVMLPPGEWDSALPAYLDFAVSGVENDAAVIEGAFWWMVRGKEWELVRGGSTILSGTDGGAYRQDPDALVYKTDRWVGAFDLAAEALDHLTATQFYVKQLVDSAGMNPAEYMAAAPGNPVNSTFEG